MPKVTKCMNGHFYDAERFDTCPYCNAGHAQAPGGAAQGVTVPLDGFGNTGAPKTEPIDYPQRPDSPQRPATPAPAEDDPGKTIGMFPPAGNGKNPVVGWLVCVEGPLYGEDFRLKAGNNFIGRDQSMDVTLRGDNSVSRIKHVILTYDPVGNQFIVRPGESHELTYLNHEVLLDSKLIRMYDVLSVGSCELMFIPLVGENFVWNNTK